MILASDIAMISKLHKNPNTYSLMERVSFLHHFLLLENGFAFAATKLFSSFLILAMWGWRAIRPAEVGALGYATQFYSLAWLLIGALALTGVVGVLQFSTGLPVNVFDFSALTSATSFSTLLLLALIVTGLPLMLLYLPRLHNHLLRRANA